MFQQKDEEPEICVFILSSDIFSEGRTGKARQGVQTAGRSLEVSRTNTPPQVCSQVSRNQYLIGLLDTCELN